MYLRLVFTCSFVSIQGEKYYINWGSEFTLFNSFLEMLENILYTGWKRTYSLINTDEGSLIAIGFRCCLRYVFFDFQAGSSTEEYVKQQEKTVSSSTSSSTSQQYRSVQLDNIPLPTTGGHVTGLCKSHGEIYFTLKTLNQFVGYSCTDTIWRLV